MSLPAIIVPKIPQESQPDAIVEIDDAVKRTPPKMIILYTKALTAEDVEIISRYGKVLRYNASLINIPWNDLHFQYLLCDATDKVCLANVERHLNDADLTFCHYGHFYENETFADINHVSKIRYAATREDFNASMLSPKKLPRPNKIISFLSFLVNCIAHLKR